MIFHIALLLLSPTVAFRTVVAAGMVMRLPTPQAKERSPITRASFWMVVVVMVKEVSLHRFWGHERLRPRFFVAIVAIVGTRPKTRSGSCKIEQMKAIGHVVPVNLDINQEEEF